MTQTNRLTTTFALVSLTIAGLAHATAPGTEAAPSWPQPAPATAALTAPTNEHNTPRVTPVTDSTETGTQSDLARRMNAALRGESKRPHKTADKKSTTPNQTEAKTWQCGHWEELWQGRGSARSCEWR